MKRTLTLKLSLSLLAVLLASGLTAQLREVKLYCSDDFTIDEGHPEAGIAWGNNLCNNDDDGANGNGYQEAWIKWDLSSIQLEPGEEIISALVLLRSAYNAEGQGYQAIALDDKYDTWSENDFNWSKAESLGDFRSEGGDTIVELAVAGQYTDYLPGEHLVTDKFSMLSRVNAEISGNKALTIRLKPYYDTFDGTDKKWLGFYPRQPHETWNQEMAEAPNEDISAWAPHLRLLIAVPSKQFSEADAQFGNTDNYAFSPDYSWFGVNDHSGEGRLLMLENLSANPDSLGAIAMYAGKDDYTDFDLSLDARVNEALNEMKTNVALIFDYKDELNYASFTFYGVPESGSDKLNGIYRVVNGTRTAVGETLGGIAIADDDYHTYALKREGSVVTASIDGTVFHTVDDLTLAAGSGSLGFGSGKFLVNFDNVKEGATTGIAGKWMKSGELEVYPNPANTVISIRAEAPIGNLRMYSITGEMVWQFEKPGSEITSFDISRFPAGLYFLVGDETSPCKLIIN